MKDPSHVLIALFIAIIFWFGFLHENIVYGATSTDVDAKITISVCGNNIAEGGEDCDNEDLKGATCQSLGYGGGALTCNVSCSYDTSICAAPTVTPQSVQESNTTTTVPNVSQSQTTSSPTQPTITTAEEITNTNGLLRSRGIPNTYEPVAQQRPLPSGLEYFDINNIGKILLRDLSTVVTLWVDEWRIALKNETYAKNESNKCDVNHDKRCDITDFSILMSYIQK